MGYCRITVKVEFNFLLKFVGIKRNHSNLVFLQIKKLEFEIHWVFAGFLLDFGHKICKHPSARGLRGPRSDQIFNFTLKFVVSLSVPLEPCHVFLLSFPGHVFLGSRTKRKDLLTDFCWKWCIFMKMEECKRSGSIADNCTVSVHQSVQVSVEGMYRDNKARVVFARGLDRGREVG